MQQIDFTVRNTSCHLRLALKIFRGVVGAFLQEETITILREQKTWSWGSVRDECINYFRAVRNEIIQSSLRKI